MPAAVPRTPPPRVSSLPPPPRTPQTPRHHKRPPNHGLDGTKPLTDRLKPAALGKRLKHALKLKFEPDSWQLEVISRVLRGFDAIVCAGTGYGKSLVFEGLAVLGGKKKVVIVISPLKALEKDQVLQASAKGINAILINEDNSHESTVWETARATAQLLYLSPEMSLSDGFANLWKNAQFRRRLQAVAIDEAHCVEEWGTDDFRPQYRNLNILRHFTGQEIPFISFTATCMTTTFDRLWESLAYGFRPFWGLDVGCDRVNLFYEVRAIVNKKQPVLDILGLLPDTLDDSTHPNVIPKTILYFDSEDACRAATDALRKCLPAHLRSSIHAFSSVLSVKAKDRCWSRFSSGEYRFLCATDAAGMGCNVPDIQNIVIFNCPRTLSVVSQRWGRAGRDRKTPAMCLLLVPQWAFRPVLPSEPGSTLAVQQLKGKKKQVLEDKRHTAQRNKLPAAVEGFVNAKMQEDVRDRCLHGALRQVFQPTTQLTTYTDLANRRQQETGGRSLNSSFSLTWTLCDLGRRPPASRCCNLCNPEHPDRVPHPVPNDLRLSRYAHQFLVPLVEPPTRSPSVVTVVSLSGRSESSAGASTVAFEPLVGQHSVPKEVRDILHRELLDWRQKERPDDSRDFTFLSPAVDFSDKTIDKLVENCARFLSMVEVTPQEISKVVKWDSGTVRDREDVAHIISLWRVDAALSATPKSQRRKKKKARTATSPSVVPLDMDPEPELPDSPSPSPRPALSRDATPRARASPERLTRPGATFHSPSTPTGPHRYAQTMATSRTSMLPPTMPSQLVPLSTSQAMPYGSQPRFAAPVPIGGGYAYPATPFSQGPATPPPSSQLPTMLGYSAGPYSPMPMRMMTPPPSQLRTSMPPHPVPSPAPSPSPHLATMVYHPIFYGYPPPPHPR